MFDYILLILSILSNGLYNAMMKLLGRKSDATLCDTMRINVVIYTIISIIIGVAAIFSGERYSIGCFLLGILFGGVTAMSGVFKLMAFATGEMSFTVVLVSASMIIPALAGAIFWHEPLSVFKVVGAVIIIVSSCFSTKKSGRKRERGWFAYCFSAFFFMGLVGILQKVQRSTGCADSPKLFLLTAFLTALAICLPFTFNSNRSIKNLATDLTCGKIICLLVAGGTLAFANLINLYLVGVLPSALLFPAQNGGSTLLSVLIAAAIFKERPDGRQKIALISSLCGLAILFI